MTIPRIEPYELPGRADLPVCRLNAEVDPRRAALLIHDVQDYFLDFFDGRLLQRVVDNIARVRQACYDAGVPVVYTAQPAEQTLEDRGLLQDLWGPGITAHPRRTGIHPRLTPGTKDLVLTKWRYSAFVRSPLRSWLHENTRDQLLICGVYAHIGCQSTALDAFMSDVVPILVSDAVADFSRAKHLDALHYVAGCCGLVRDTEQVLKTLTGPAVQFNQNASSSDSVTHDVARDVATVLEVEPETLDDSANLFDFGLDSVRLMTLVDQWSAKGYPADLMDLAEEPTLAAWSRKLTASSPSGRR